MINVGELARRLGNVVGRSSGDRVQVSPDDVLRYLRPQGHGSVALELSRDQRDLDALDRVVAELPRVIVEERLPRRHPGFRRYFEALPRILFFYGRGYSSDDIASEMSFIATGYGIETVLGIVAQTVSRRVARAA